MRISLPIRECTVACPRFHQAHEAIKALKRFGNDVSKIRTQIITDPVLHDVLGGDGSVATSIAWHTNMATNELNGHARDVSAYPMIQRYAVLKTRCAICELLPPEQREEADASAHSAS